MTGPQEWHVWCLHAWALETAAVIIALIADPAYDGSDLLDFRADPT